MICGSLYKKYNKLYIYIPNEIGMKVCPSGYLNGFRGRVLEYQGIFHDDVAVTDVAATCTGSSDILTGLNYEPKVSWE